MGRCMSAGWRRTQQPRRLLERPRLPHAESREPQLHIREIRRGRQRREDQARGPHRSNERRDVDVDGPGSEVREPEGTALGESELCAVRGDAAHGKDAREEDGDLH